MKNVRLSRTTFQLIERAVEALERIGRELERYNDRYERTAERDGADEPDRNGS